MPTVWISPGELRDQRDLPRTRMVFVRQCTQLKSRIHATLAKYALRNLEVSAISAACVAAVSCGSASISYRRTPRTPASNCSRTSRRWVARCARSKDGIVRRVSASRPGRLGLLRLRAEGSRRVALGSVRPRELALVRQLLDRLLLVVRAREPKHRDRRYVDRDYAVKLPRRNSIIACPPQHSLASR